MRRLRGALRTFAGSPIPPLPEEARLLLQFLRAEPLTSRFHAELKPYEDLLLQHAEAVDGVTQSSSEDAAFYHTEAVQLAAQIASEKGRLVEEVLQSMQKRELNEVRGAIVELRQAAGGEESLLFAEELFNAYCSFAQAWGMRPESLSSPQTKLLRFRARGEQAYPRLRCEAGVHKVVRVPTTDSKGRLHSSTVSVVVLPDVPFDFHLSEKELKFEYMRAQGPGGQHVNKTESACRVTHVPTGLAVLIQEDRSQARNRQRAVEVLREKLYFIEQQRHFSKAVDDRKEQRGSGERSDKIRTYHYTQDRITDHRLSRTWTGLVSHMATGEAFAEAIDAVLEAEWKKREADFFTQLREAADPQQ